MFIHRKASEQRFFYCTAVHFHFMETEEFFHWGLVGGVAASAEEVSKRHQDSRHHAMSFIHNVIFLTTTRLARISDSINRNVFHHLSISVASFYVTDVHIVF